jgi:hypothetical protein
VPVFLNYTWSGLHLAAQRRGLCLGVLVQGAAGAARQICRGYLAVAAMRGICDSTHPLHMHTRATPCRLPACAVSIQGAEGLCAPVDSRLKEEGCGCRQTSVMLPAY